MKKLTLLVIFYSIFHLTIGQWEYQNPVPSDAMMNDIFFVDSLNGWTVGEFLTILHTEDGGNTWNEQLNANDNNWYHFSTFNSVYFSDLNCGWAVGHWFMPYGGGYNGIIFHTIDGGESWSEIVLNYGTHSFCDIHFIDDSKGWLIDALGEILYTDDGWSNFSIQYNDSTSILNSLFFIDGNTGWVCGEEGLILHTDDGGLSWNEQPTGVNINISSIFFNDDQRGWSIGDNEEYPRDAKIMYTEDGGNNWVINYDGGPHLNMGRVFFTDENHGWVTIKPTFDGACLLQTTDGGVSWDYRYLNMQYYSIQSIFFSDNNKGWVSCDNAILNTVDAGETWNSNSVSNYYFNDLTFFDFNTGWAIGYELDINEGSELWRTILVKTIDGGINWFQLELEFPLWFAQEDKLTNVFFVDINHGWLWGNGIFRTSDGGLSWEDYLTCANDLFFIDSITGWKSCGQYIYRSNDGGISWGNEYDLGEVNISSIYFLDDQRGWAAGGSDDDAIIYITVDGGVTWELQFSASGWSYNSELYSIFFTDQYHGWAVGFNHTILFTSDGGESWTLQDSESYISYFKSVFFVDNNKGWIVGADNNSHYPYALDRYEILYTENGGEDWEIQVSRPFGALNAVCFIGQEMGWAVGKGGTIMHTDNGGIAGIDRSSMANSLNTLNIKTYPNPTHSTLTIELSTELSNNTTLTLSSTNGQQLITQPITKPQTEIDISHLPVGIYIVKVWNDKDVMVQKVIKQ